MQPIFFKDSVVCGFTVRKSKKQGYSRAVINQRNSWSTETLTKKWLIARGGKLKSDGKLGSESSDSILHHVHLGNIIAHDQGRWKSFWAGGAEKIEPVIMENYTSLSPAPLGYCCYASLSPLERETWVFYRYR